MFKKTITILCLLYLLGNTLDQKVLAFQNIKSSNLIADTQLENKNEVPTDEISKKYGFNLVQEMIIGRTVAYGLIERFNNKMVTDEKINHYVNLVGQSIVQKTSKRPQIKYRFGIIDTPGVNAFACPGGYIFVTSGLLKILKNETELAAVLAHEVGHVEHGDGLKDINEHRQDEFAKIKMDNLEQDVSIVHDVASSLPYAGWYANYYSPSSIAKRGLSRAFGYIPGYGGYVAYSAVDVAFDQALKGFKKLLKVFGEKAITRWYYTPLTPEVEYKADEFSIKSLYQLGYNPEGMVSFLKSVRDIENILSEGSSAGDQKGVSGANESKMFTYRHPATSSRIEKLDGIIRDNNMNTAVNTMDNPQQKTRFFDNTSSF